MNLIGDDEVAFIINELGYAYAAQGKYEVAERYYKKALKISEKYFKKSTMTATAAEGGGEGTNGVGSAETRKFLKDETAHWGRKVAASLNDLGKLYMDQSRYVVAEEHLKNSLLLREKYSSKEHRMRMKGKSKVKQSAVDDQVIESTLALGACYTRLGKYNEAEEMLNRALAVYKPNTTIESLLKSSLEGQQSQPQQPQGSSTPITSKHGSKIVLDKEKEKDEDDEMDLMALLRGTAKDHQKLLSLKLSKIGSTDYQGLQMATCLDHLGRLLTIKGNSISSFILNHS